MLTIFSTPKPFCGHIRVIQRNAISSWTRLHPDVEIILFGNEQGAAEAARDLGICHEPDVRTNATGTKILGDIFARAQQMARHDLLCYLNCDIILTSDFRRAVQTVAATRKKFLMIGRRWDMEITQPLALDEPDWDDRLVAEVRRVGRERPAQWIDYFVFTRGLYRDIPEFLIGRVGWDNWLVWKAGDLNVPVVDASAMVTAVHQNHDYSYHPEGEAGVWYGEEARRNIQQAGGWSHLHSIRNSSHRLTARGVQRRRFYRLVHMLDATMRGLYAAASAFLRVTRPLRHSLGLRKQNFQRAPRDAAYKKVPRTPMPTRTPRYPETKANPEPPTNDRDFYERFWADFSSELSVQLAIHQESSRPLLNLLAQHLPARGPSRFLEVGCGTGLDTCLLARARPHAQATAVDLASRAVARLVRNARELDLRVQAAVGDLLSLPFPDRHFDLVFSQGVVEHLPDPHAAVEEQVRILRPGGVLVVDVPQKFNLYTWRKHRAMRENRWNWGWETEYSVGELKALGRRLGLQVVGMTGHQHGRVVDRLLMHPHRLLRRKFGGGHAALQRYRPGRLSRTWEETCDWLDSRLGPYFAINVAVAFRKPMTD